MVLCDLKFKIQLRLFRILQQLTFFTSSFPPVWNIPLRNSSSSAKFFTVILQILYC